jgi:dihydroorotate dehydrogenase (fumarate)
MKKLKTNYLGLELSSPLIMSSSGLSKTVNNIKIAEENGVGAVVLKSLFEEQIIFESNKTISQSIDYPEAVET